MNTLLKKVLPLFLSLLCLLTAAVPASAASLEPGLYTSGRKTSYANPETGKTEDGGTNIALGDSMCSGILDQQILIEKDGSKTYVTIGIGMASFLENIRIKVQQPNGTYKEVAYEQTGKCTRDDDDCLHLRFEVPSETSRFSPIFYVAPMQRDVQFFAWTDGTPVPGNTTNFKAEKGTPEGIAAAKAHKRNVTIGITAGILILAVLLLFLIRFLLKKSKTKKESAKEASSDE